MKKLSLLIFPFLLFLGCNKDSTISLNEKIPQETGDWVKVNLNSTLYDFAFDSKGEVYFLSDKYLIHTDQNFSLQDTILKTSPIPSTYLHKIFISNNDVLFACPNNGFNLQLILSKDKGKSWIVPSSFTNTQIQDFSSKGNRVYIVSSGHDESSALVQISEDEGTSWRKIINKRQTESFSFCKENDPGEIFFGSNKAFYYSHDFGKTYIEKKVSFKYPWLNSLAIGTNGKLVLGNNSGIFLTEDNGTSFKTIIDNDNIADYYLVFNVTKEKIVAMHIKDSQSTKDGLQEVLVSYDGGLNWIKYLDALDGYTRGTYQLGPDGYLYIIVEKELYKGNLYRSRSKLF